MRSILLLLTPSLASCFAIQRPHSTRASAPRTVLFAEPNADDESNSTPNELILDMNAVNQQMAGLRSKYPTAEADYLAAARARAAARAESKNDGATDDDWKQVKEKTRAQGNDDDWEVSAREAGNIDSQILIPMMNDDDDEEPKLMLF